jgi:type II secretory pathway pseudopilin PulG
MSALLPCSSSRSARFARRRGQAGFTLIELTVALVSGLIVAMGIVGLSREATNTFNDEARSSAAEGGLRVAIERLRADLQRAGYMSTGNILADPALALVPGSSGAGSNNQTAYKPTVGSPTGFGMSGLQNLASIFWADNGSNSGTIQNQLTLSASQTPVALTPDIIQIAGNMTTSEQFDVELIVPGSNAACTSGGTKITLSPNSPAMIRTLGGTVPTSGNAASLGTLLQNLFSPDGTSSFLLRLIDKTAHTQYLAICPPTNAQLSAGFDGNLQPYVLVDGANTPILYSNATAGNVSTIGGVSGFCVGCFVNPVQIVEWEITNSSGGATHNEPSSDSTNLGYLPSATKTLDADKYDLMRSYLDAQGNFLSGTSEVVAEYAVDLAFAFTGDSGTTLQPAASTSATTCALDDNTGCNVAWAKQVNALVPGSGYGPQRIRSVRARIATRAAQPDRSGTIPIAPLPYPVGTPFQTFMYRYYLPAGVYPAPLTWARARTVTTEVALPNQARNFY